MMKIRKAYPTDLSDEQ
jgi:transposase